MFNKIEKIYNKHKILSKFVILFLLIALVTVIFFVSMRTDDISTMETIIFLIIGATAMGVLEGLIEDIRGYFKNKRMMDTIGQKDSDLHPKIPAGHIKLTCDCGCEWYFNVIMNRRKRKVHCPRCDTKIMLPKTQ